MANLGPLPGSVRPCRCESPALDSTGTISLFNDGTYRVRHCQRCGGGYSSTRDADPLPAEAPVTVWECPRCGAGNLAGYRRCTNCPSQPDDWTCPACGCANPATERRCAQCRERRPGSLILLPN